MILILTSVQSTTGGGLVKSAIVVGEYHAD